MTSSVLKKFLKGKKCTNSEHNENLPYFHCNHNSLTLGILSQWTICSISRKTPFQWTILINYYITKINSRAMSVFTKSRRRDRHVYYWQVIHATIANHFDWVVCMLLCKGKAVIWKFSSSILKSRFFYSILQIWDLHMPTSIQCFLLGHCFKWINWQE
jgi:hypothetical protein